MTSVTIGTENFLASGIIGTLKVPDKFNFIPTYGIGPHIYSQDGKKYIDYLMGSGPLILGHCNPSVIQAVKNQIDRGSSFYYTTEQALELAKLIVEAVPCAEKLSFTATGTEATMTALRLARAYTGKDKILKFEGAYHGWHDYAMLSSSYSHSSTADKSTTPSIDSAGIPEGATKSVLVAPYNNVETTKRILKEHKDEVGGVIVEPIQRTIFPDEAFLQELREVTSALGVVLIFDEIVTGFRVRYGGAQELYGVEPDLACIGKIIGGGYPLAAVTGRTDIFETYLDRKSRKRIIQIGTLSGNPVSCAAGIATLTQLSAPGTYDKLDRYATKLLGGIKEIFERNKVAVQAAAAGGLADYAFCTEPIKDFKASLRSNRKLKNEFTQDLMAHGVLSDPSKMYLSVAHTEKELDQTLQAFEALTASYRKAGKI